MANKQSTGKKSAANKKTRKKARDKQGQPGLAKAEPKFKTPPGYEEAVTMLASLGELQRQASVTAGRLDTAMMKLREQAAKKLAPLYGEMYFLLQGLHAFATANRDELTNQGQTKTIELETGKIFWRDTPDRIVVENPKAVLKALRQMKLKQFIRQPPAEVDKRAMQRDKDKARTVPGVHFLSDEIFYASPQASMTELNLEIVADLLKKAG